MKDVKGDEELVNGQKKEIVYVWTKGSRKETKKVYIWTGEWKKRNKSCIHGHVNGQKKLIVYIWTCQ